MNKRKKRVRRYYKYFKNSNFENVSTNNYKIVLEDVSFSYPNKDKKVIKDLSLKMLSGLPQKQH